MYRNDRNTTRTEQLNVWLDGNFITFHKMTNVSCYATAKRNKINRKIPTLPLIHLLLCDIALIPENKISYNAHGKSTPPFKIMRNYRSVTLVLSIKYLWGTLRWVHIASSYLSTAYIFTVCRKLIAYGMYAQQKYLLFYRYVSPLFFFMSLNISSCWKSLSKHCEALLEIEWQAHIIDLRYWVYETFTALSKSMSNGTWY